MAFFSKYVTDFVKTTISSISPFKVEEITYQNLINDYKNYSVMVSLDERYTLYRVANYYELIFIPPIRERIDKSKAYSLFRFQGILSDAKKLHQQYFSVISVLEKCFPNEKIDKPWLEKVCIITKTHSNWTAAHVAAHLEWLEAFRSSTLSSLINIADKVTGVTPLHLAVSSANLELVKEMLLMDNIDLNIVDADENTVLHLAASHESPHILNLLVNKSSNSVNYLNTSGRGPLHVACEAKAPACIDTLLRFGADPNFSEATEFPIHVAMRVDSMECVKLLCQYFPEQIKAQCPMTGATALHLAKSKTSLDVLINLGADVNAQNNDGLTCLHVMVKENNFDLVLALLLLGADTNIVTNLMETPLHFAIKDCDVDLIRALIIFEVDVNAVNINKESVRHLLCTNKTNKYNYSKTRDIALYTIYAVGARRCPDDMNYCTEGCAFYGSFNGKPPTAIHVTVDHTKDVLEETLSAAHLKNNKTQNQVKKSQSVDLTNIPQVEDYENRDSDWSYSDNDILEQNFEKHLGLRVLSLDGGGIRGLILTQTLRALERVSGRRIVEMFDWIGGTSTGGLLAISIVYKMSLKDCRIMYMKMKDKIFVGKRPYSSEYLETIVKEQVGENTMMSFVPYPKLTVTGLLCDRFPPKLHLFRNYDPPLSNLKTSILQRNDEVDKKVNEKSKPPSLGTHDASSYSTVKPPSQQLVWECAKATGAAPTFFRACGPFLDGGLIANNPTLDMITEIFEYNLVRKHNHLPEEPLGIVVSLGTGRIPITPTGSVDVFRPNNPIDVYNIVQGMSTLTKIIVEMATISEGRVVDRARAWCGSLAVPFFRFSPPLSSDTNLDEIDNKIILQMLWDTECYLYRSEDRLKQLSELL